MVVTFQHYGISNPMVKPSSHQPPAQPQPAATGACGGDFVLHPEHGGGHISNP
jgi:hypothetical protein